MTPKDLRSKTPQELDVLLKDWREELFKLKMQDKTGQLQKPHRLGEVRKNIARLLTILKEKQLKAA